MEVTNKPREIGIINDARLEREVRSLHLVIEIKLVDGDMFQAWLSKDNAWQLLDESGSINISDLKGRPVIVQQISDESYKYVEPF